jgi:anti-sigma factor RsiW
MASLIDELELHLYVDGHLDEERRSAVEAYLQHYPEAAARVSDYRRQNELLRQLFLASSAPPQTKSQERIVRQLDHRLGRPYFARWRPAIAAAAVVVAAGLGAVTMELYDGRSGLAPEPVPSFAETAARVHSFYAGTASEPTEFGADAAGKLSNLIDKRLGAPLRLPDLSQKGFSLVGGRLLPAQDGTAAQLLYRDQGGRLVTVFVAIADKMRLTPAHPIERQDLSLYTWLDGRIGVAVVGGLSGDELRGIAEAAQRTLLPQANGPRPEERSTSDPGKDGRAGASRT